MEPRTEDYLFPSHLIAHRGHSKCFPNQNGNRITWHSCWISSDFTCVRSPRLFLFCFVFSVVSYSAVISNQLPYPLIVPEPSCSWGVGWSRWGGCLYSSWPNQPYYLLLEGDKTLLFIKTGSLQDHQEEFWTHLWGWMTLILDLPGLWEQQQHRLPDTVMMWRLSAVTHLWTNIRLWDRDIYHPPYSDSLWSFFHCCFSFNLVESTGDVLHPAAQCWTI